MAVYHVHFFNRDGLMSHTEDFVCENVEDAIRTVSQSPHRHGMALFCGDRVVRRFNPKGPLGFKRPPLTFAWQRSWLNKALSY